MLLIIKVVVPEPYIFFCIPASITDEAVFNPKIGKTFVTKGIATFNKGHNNLPKKPPDWPIFLIVPYIC